MYFDSHAHYDDERFDDDRNELLASFPDEGIENVVNSSSDIASSKASVALTEKYPFFYASVGVHPHEVEKMTEQDLLELETLSKHEKVVAIGEIGLDFYYDLSPRDMQRYWFKRQLELAERLDMPTLKRRRTGMFRYNKSKRSKKRSNPLLQRQRPNGKRLYRYGILYRYRRQSDF